MRRSCEYFKAIESLDKAIELKNDYADAYFTKGCCLWGLNKDQEALEFFDEAIKYQLVQAYNYKGLLLSNNLNESSELFRKALDLNADPSSAEDFFNKACSLHGLNQYVEAISNCNTAIELNANEAKYYIIKGLALDLDLDLNRPEEAIEIYKKAIQIDSKYALAYIKIGACLNRLERYEEAITYFAAATQIDRYAISSYKNKGCSLYYLGKYEEAIK